jgi:uncharacterized protein YndB with AHSA1/START domain
MATPQPLDPWAARSEIEIGVPMERVWRALTDPRHLRRWFPVEAAGRSGAGGVLRFGWGNGRVDPMRIETWSPPHHLRLRHDTAPGAPDRVTEIHLRGRETRTHMRVETSGFPRDDAWWELMRGTGHAYRFLVLQLKHYLERSEGVERRVLSVRRRVHMEREDAWEHLQASGTLGLRLDPLLECTEPWQLLGVSVDPRGLVRIAIDGVRDEPGCRDVTVWLSAWGADGAALPDVGARVRTALDRAFPSSAGETAESGRSPCGAPDVFLGYTCPPGPTTTA